MIRRAAHVGKDEQPKEKLKKKIEKFAFQNYQYSKEDFEGADSFLNEKNEEVMDNSFDDILKVNKNNTSSEIYKRYEELIRQSEEKEQAEKNASDNAPAPSYYTLIKQIEKDDKPEPQPEIQPEIRKEELDKKEEPANNNEVMFDLFNLNFKNSETENLYQEKKLVNVNYKQKIINDENKVETVKNTNEPTFSFQKNDGEVNYQDKFRDLRSQEIRPQVKNKFDVNYQNDAPTSSVDLKNKLYSNGYKVRVYQKNENDKYYSMRYYLSNKLTRDCSIITYFVSLLLTALCYLALDVYVKLPYYVYLGIAGGFLLIPFVGTAKYVSNRNCRKQATFSFKLSFLNTIMLYLLGLVACLLVSFFAVGADISQVNTLVCPLIMPLIYLAIMPIYVIIYQTLYSTKKYFVE